MAKNLLILTMCVITFLIGVYFGRQRASLECYKIGFEFGFISGMSDKITEYKNTK